MRNSEVVVAGIVGPDGVVVGHRGEPGTGPFIVGADRGREEQHGVIGADHAVVGLHIDRRRRGSVHCAVGTRLACVPRTGIVHDEMVLAICVHPDRIPVRGGPNNPRPGPGHTVTVGALEWNGDRVPGTTERVAGRELRRFARKDVDAVQEGEAVGIGVAGQRIQRALHPHRIPARPRERQGPLDGGVHIRVRLRCRVRGRTRALELILHVDG